MANRTGMIDAVVDAGADDTAATDSTAALHNAVAMCFGFPTMVQLDAALPPAAKVRVPSRWLYIPPGVYSLQSSLVLQSMLGLVIRGGGMVITRLRGVGGTAASPLVLRV